MDELFVIEEIKWLLEEVKMEEWDNEVDYEKMNGKDCEDEVFLEKKCFVFE